MFYPGISERLEPVEQLRGMLVSQVIDCPECGRKLSLKADFAGKRLKCPHCQEAFVAPAAETADDTYPSQAEPAAGPAPAGGDFLADLHSPDPNVPRRSQTPRPSNRPKQAKSQGQIPKEWIIGGAIGGGLLLVVLIFVVIGMSASGTRTGRSSKSGSVKWGLAESTRQQIFLNLIQAVDDYGRESDGCERAWKSICAQHKIDASAREGILDEGFENGWEVPQLKVTATNKAHRVEWIAKRRR
jgi:hypothetical protein